jgi:hypothetical protein
MNRNLKYSAGFAVFFLAIALAPESLAQKARKQTVVLNDGSRVTGTIVSDTGNYLKMRITSPQVISIRKSEVFTPDPALLAHNRNKFRQNTDYKDFSGYNIRLSSSVLFGRNDQGSTGTMSFHFSNGFRFRNGLEAGAGAGIEEFEAVIVPVYADIRFHPLNTRISPFVWAGSGIGIPVDYKNREENYYYGNNTQPGPGFMFNTGAGVTIYSGRNFGVNLGIGYRYQKLVFREDNFWIQESGGREYITHFHRTEVQIGFIFH